MKTCCYLCKTREKYLVLSKFYLFRRSILIFVVVIVILQFLLEYNYWCYVSFFLFVSSVHYFMLYFILFKLNLTFQTFVEVNPVQGEFKSNLEIQGGIWGQTLFVKWVDLLTETMNGYHCYIFRNILKIHRVLTFSRRSPVQQIWAHWRV